MLFETNVAFFLHMTTYWGFVYLYSDRKKNDFFKSCENSIRNQLLITYPSLFLFLRYFSPSSTNIFLSFLHFPFYIFMTDVWFYTFHRLFHLNFFWKWHKEHHKNQINVLSIDGGMIEHFLVNRMSVIVGPIITNKLGYAMNIHSFYAWIIFVTANSCLSHIPNKKNIVNNVIHENHHKYLWVNYGAGFYVMDKILGTYRE